MSFPRYPKYKASGVEWLGEVPEHWEVVRLKGLIAEIDERTGDQDLELLGLSKSLGVVKRSQLTQGASESDNYENYKVAIAGQLVMNKMQAWNGVFGICPIQGMVSPDYAVFRFVRNEFDKFLCSLFRTELMAGVFFTRCRGMGSAFLRLNTPDFLDIKVSLPSAEEARHIAAFLDHETAKIDELVAEQERLIDLLKEKRQAVISHAVTKGLNPDAPMKDSGIEWLGEVPEHWEVKPLGRITLSRCDGPFGSGLKSEHYADSGVRVIRLQNIRAEGFNDSDAAFIEKEYHDNDLTGHEVVAEDVLIAGLGDDKNLVGRACVAPVGIEPAMVKADCFRFRLNREHALPAFLATVLSVSATFDAGMLATGTTRSRIPLSITSGRRIPLPPLPEQITIAAFLDHETAKFTTLTTEANRVIDLLKERRTALISAAVTGQIDVRNLVSVESA